MLEAKASLIEAAEGLKGGMWVYLHNYVTDDFEVQNLHVHADASYESVHERSNKKLDEIMGDIMFSVDISRNFYVDEAGNEHMRQKKGKDGKPSRKLQTQSETVKSDDPDMQEAFARVRKSIVDPRSINTGFEKEGNSVYGRGDNDKTYFRNVLLGKKVVVKPGVYDVSCSSRVPAITEAIKKLLPISEYRTYVLDDRMVDMPDGSKMKKFEYVSIMGDKMSSSSSED